MTDYGVIFDMDGVLVDSYQAHFHAWRKAARGVGLDVSEDDFTRTFGRTSRDIINHLWPRKFDEEGIKAFDKDKEADYRELIRTQFPEMTGAGHLIAQLHQAGFRLAIGSSGPPENVAVVRQCIPHGALIDATVNGTEVKHGKPDPEVFVLAAGKLNLAPQRCAVVEDAVAGIEAARRAGCAAIALTGTASRQALGLRAHLVVDSLTELTPQKIQEMIASLA